MMSLSSSLDDERTYYPFQQI